MEEIELPANHEDLAHPAKPSAGGCGGCGKLSAAELENMQRIKAAGRDGSKT